jgi:glycosyltransferase involved in cell wall biosynthesis
MVDIHEKTHQEVSFRGGRTRRGYGALVRQRFSLRRRADWLLALLDVGSAILVSYVAYLLRFEGVQVPHHYVGRYKVMTLVLAVVWVGAARPTALYRRSALRVGTSLTAAAFEAAVTAGLVVWVVDAVFFNGDVSRAWIGLTVLGLMLLGVGARASLRRLRRLLVPLGIGLERYAIVGEGREARRLHADLTRAAGAPFEIADILSPALGPAMLADMALAERLDGLILSADLDPATAADLAPRLAGFGVDAYLAPRLGELELRVASISTFHGVPLLRVAGLAPRRPALRTTPRDHLSHGVAIMGTRGIPANYGGFETFAERLALHLVERGVPVTVYCRRHFATQTGEWNGVRLVTLPTIANKYLDTVVHTLLSTLHLVTRSRVRDVVLCNAANAPVLPVLRAAGRRVVMNVDGLEWRRGKWGIVGRAWYRMGEWLSVRASSVLVTDAEEVRTYYRVRHDTDSIMIPYGADLLPRHLPLPDELGVRPDRFVLYVSRWEPENNPLMVADAHRQAGVDVALVMLGRATYDEGLETAVRRAAARNAVLPGPVFGEGYRALQSNALCYIHATEVGGTHPALIEAMGAGNLCLVLDTPENREVAGPAAWFFGDAGELSSLLVKATELEAEELERLRERSRERARESFSWSAVGEAYLRLLRTE